MTPLFLSSICFGHGRVQYSLFYISVFLVVAGGDRVSRVFRRGRRRTVKRTETVPLRQVLGVSE